MVAKSIKKIFGIIALTSLYLISAKNSSATSKIVLDLENLTLLPLENQNDNLQITQNCEEGKKSQQYVQVITLQGESLEVRSSPDGRVIGAIPSGWNVISLRQDATGRWTQIADHHTVLYGGNLFEGATYFRSAPLFRKGWLKSSSLKNVGQHCDKPVSLQSLYPQRTQMGLAIPVNEDWLQLGDRIAKAYYKQISQ